MVGCSASSLLCVFLVFITVRDVKVERRVVATQADVGVFGVSDGR